MRSLTAVLCIVALLMAPLSAGAEETASCVDLQKELSTAVTALTADLQGRVDGLSADLQKKVDKIQDDMPDSDGIDGSVGVDVDVEWKLQTIKLHLPEVVMKAQKWIYHLPSITVKDKKMIFHTPGTCMKRKKIGQYPELHGLKVVWKDIIADVPEPCSKKQEIVVGVPEVRMEEQRTILHVPEFAMRLQEIKMHLPEFRVADVKVEAGKAEKKAKAAEADFKTELSREQALLLDQARRDVTPKVTALFACYRADVENKKAAVATQFVVPVAQLSGAVETLRAQGATNQAAELESKLGELRAQQAKAEQRFDESLKKLAEQETETLERLFAGLGG